ncbi:hypothetical protein ANN_22472, partial [Periplaneta americana]
LATELRVKTGSVCLLGDSGHEVSPRLLTPSRPPRHTQEEMYNIAHSRERVVIQYLFGQMKQRFPILVNCIRTYIEIVSKLILSYTVLQNVATDLQNVYHEVEEIRLGGTEFNLHIEENNRIRCRGEQKRQQIV